MNPTPSVQAPADFAPTPRTEAGHEWLCCQAGGQVLGVPVAAVREVVRCAELSPIPLTPPLVRGAINLRGTPLLTLDLAALLGLAVQPPRRHSAVLVVHPSQDRTGAVIGLWVDRVHEILNLDVAQVGAAPLFGAAIDRRFIRLVVEWRRQTLLGLDLDAALALDARAEEIAAHAGAWCAQVCAGDPRTPPAPLAR